ncbi:MAG: glycosyltransferase [Parachlamydiales bacterium]|jgi:glycosyltransferase involved in cell wall biosynthesis
MKVLIADFDLFHEVGGGQTIYKTLIKKNPKIDFFYLIDNEPIQTERPANAYPIKCKNYFNMLRKTKSYSGILKYNYTIVNKIAQSLKNSSFDIIDVPDYRQYGIFFRPAFKKYNVSFRKIVLSLLGNISISVKMDWDEISDIHELQRIEALQYESVDIRYGISKRYNTFWEEKTKIKAEYINPLFYIDYPKNIESFENDQLPQLVFLGRAEKYKGPDIFIDILWNLDKNLYSNAIIMGKEYETKNFSTSTKIFKNMAHQRSLKIDVLPTFNTSQRNEVFSKNSLVFLTSRYDVFNILSLEALLSGCPIALGDGAGAIDFLDEKFKDIPYVKIETKNIFSSTCKINHILKNYAAYRRNLIEKVKNLQANFEASIEDIYNVESKSNPYSILLLDSYYQELAKLEQDQSLFNKSIKHIIDNLLPIKLKNFIKTILHFVSSYPGKTKKILKAKIRNIYFIKFLYYPLRILLQKNKFSKIKNLAENTDSDIKNKLLNYYDLLNVYKFCKIKIYKEISHLERYLGNYLIAAVYDLRIMRLLGFDKFKRLPLVVEELKQCGSTEEAGAAAAMFENDVTKKEKCLELLNNAYKKHIKLKTLEEYTIIDDSRKKENYKVSIIVSLYNAEDKLHLFLSSINNQTLVLNNEAELILVETDSKRNDYDVFKKFQKANPDKSFIYLQTKNRETIQSAWNRGISHSKGKYLCFLGVDEIIRPDALEILSKKLDENPKVDWVQANSLVTNVDEHASWILDVMQYDRSNFKQENVYLETCYISWVGGLYRKSIHERFGYYDPSFKAAGDTEFKKRIIPYINTMHIDQLLGIFLNYPDGQTTNSPIAEVEDLRGWYLPRTSAGIEYAFSSYSKKRLEELFFSSLGYRKSYNKHLSTDIEFANLVLKYIKQKHPDSLILKYEKSLNKHLKYFQSIEESFLSFFKYLIVLLLNKMNPLKKDDIFKNIKIFNDNRFEQHVRIWKSNN